MYNLGKQSRFPSLTFIAIFSVLGNTFPMFNPQFRIPNYAQAKYADDDQVIAYDFK